MKIQTGVFNGTRFKNNL